MSKAALFAGFCKQGYDMGLDNFHIRNLWNQSLNYPEFGNRVNKMANDSLDMSFEDLDTLSNLQKISELSKGYPEIKDFDNR